MQNNLNVFTTILKTGYLFFGVRLLPKTLQFPAIISLLVLPKKLDRSKSLSNKVDMSIIPFNKIWSLINDHLSCISWGSCWLAITDLSSSIQRKFGRRKLYQCRYTIFIGCVKKRWHYVRFNYGISIFFLFHRKADFKNKSWILDW